MAAIDGRRRSREGSKARPRRHGAAWRRCAISSRPRSCVLTPEAIIIGKAVLHGSPTTSCIAVPGQHAETLVIKFDLAGIAVSAGFGSPAPARWPRATC